MLPTNKLVANLAVQRRDWHRNTNLFFDVRLLDIGVRLPRQCGHVLGGWITPLLSKNLSASCSLVRMEPRSCLLGMETGVALGFGEISVAAGTYESKSNDTGLQKVPGRDPDTVSSTTSLPMLISFILGRGMRSGMPKGRVGSMVAVGMKKQFDVETGGEEYVFYSKRDGQGREIAFRNHIRHVQ